MRKKLCGTVLEEYVARNSQQLSIRRGLITSMRSTVVSSVTSISIMMEIGLGICIRSTAVFRPALEMRRLMLRSESVSIRD